ncbi:MAG: hypothetical protein A4E65_02226 [Syntrophorhabdus sp. PtaU1.Bin153]|nr:MAG: hypothetical protein A4E65_02226 [Syntrophorhabdus sp. PtaU1.Bin153]
MSRRESIIFILPFIVVVFVMSGCGTMNVELNRGGTAMEAVRLSPQETYSEVSSGRALLVCGYESEEKCNKVLLDGAISLKNFESMLPELKKDQPIVFYCA